MQESELHDTIVLQEATENSMQQIEKQRISDFRLAGQPQEDKTASKEIKGKDNEVGEPIVVDMPKQSPDANENIPRDLTSTRPLSIVISTTRREVLDHLSITTAPKFGAFRRRMQKFRKRKLNYCEE